MRGLKPKSALFVRPKRRLELSEMLRRLPSRERRLPSKELKLIASVQRKTHCLDRRRRRPKDAR